MPICDIRCFMTSLLSCPLLPDTPMAIFADHRVDLDTLRARARNSYTPVQRRPIGYRRRGDR